MSFTQRVSLLFFVLLGAAACDPDVAPTLPLTGVLYESNFSAGTDGWKADFADYSTANGDMQLRSDWTVLPKPLDSTRRSIMLSGMNRSDDLFMYLTRSLTGLQPNHDYKLVFGIELASPYATNSFGIGGSPGSSVYVKAGASATEPKRQLINDFYEINVDKGNQAQGGKDVLVLGNIGAGEDVEQYTLINRNNADAPLTVRSDSNGQLWLIVGTDSGHEGLTTLYYSRIRVTAL
ncbi:hypothetical protein [Spirosoma rhododendri]|uniref:Lipoprotein n=1 Tax=Spirosoma rhododendri TaxID=2728024 RepID=A0A7L5DLR2_9BACT|nr:hypothetical protein [Spirosoma rhododendri]QJD77378.1 hypothetical protein HH216_02295 [Spirosoma rhododendri]